MFGMLFQWLASVICMQGSIAKHMQQQQLAQNIKKEPEDQSQTDAEMTGKPCTSSAPTSPMQPAIKATPRQAMRQMSTSTDSLNGDVSNDSTISAKGPRMMSLLSAAKEEEDLDLLSAEDLLPGHADSLSLRKTMSHGVDTALKDSESSDKSASDVTRTESGVTASSAANQGSKVGGSQSTTGADSSSSALGALCIQLDDDTSKT